VAWYNGHPDYRNYIFDLSQEHAAVVGICSHGCCSDLEQNARRTGPN
jgi:hypothetical protein